MVTPRCRCRYSGVNLWIDNWKRRGWKTAKGEAVKNPGIIRLIDAHLTRRKQFGQTVKFEYVKGHSGDIGNDGADTQANLGTKKSDVPERDWEGDLERLLQDQELDIPPGVLDDPGEEVEPPSAVAPSARKRSRSPARVRASSSGATGGIVQPPKTPSRDTAKRVAAIEAAFKSPPPELAQPSPHRAAIEEALKTPAGADKPSARAVAIEDDLKSPQADPEQPPRKKRAVTPPRIEDVPQPAPSSSRNPTSKSSRMANLEAALAGAPTPVSPTKSAALGSKIAQRNSSTSAITRGS